MQPQRADTKPENKTHTVVIGDTLWAIAALNNVTNPNLIYPGQVFQLLPR